MYVSRRLYMYQGGNISRGPYMYQGGYISGRSGGHASRDSTNVTSTKTVMLFPSLFFK